MSIEHYILTAIAFLTVASIALVIRELLPTKKDKS